MYEARLICVLAVVLGVASARECSEELSCQRLELVPAHLNYRNRAVPSIALKCQVNLTCHIDIYNLLKKQPDFNTTQESFTSIDLHFICSMDVYKFDFSETSQGTKWILAAIRLENCNTSWKDLSYLGSKYHIMDVETILTSGSAIKPHTHHVARLPGLAVLRYMTFTFINLTGNVNVADILPYADRPMDTIATLRVQCWNGFLTRKYCTDDTVSYNASQLRVLFPRIQTLALSGAYPVDTETNLNFPWYQEYLKLNFNLSLSDYYWMLATHGYRKGRQQTYSSRTLTIAGRTHVNISKICPSGKNLEAINFVKNRLNYIPANCFSPAPNQRSNLFLLEISHQNLTQFEGTLFRDLGSLQVLYVTNTRLRKLQKGLFDDLVNLKLLNLFSNRIEELSEGLLTRLVALETIFLQRNRIHHIDDRSFPIYSHNLTFIDLRWNNLSEIPYDCLTLPNLDQCHCGHNVNILLNLGRMTQYFNPVKLYFVQALEYYGKLSGHPDILVSHETVQSRIVLTDNKVYGIDFNNSWPIESKRQLATMFSYYQFDLESNDTEAALDCDCNLFWLKEFISNPETRKLIDVAVRSRRMRYEAANFQSWRCNVNPILKISMKPFLDTLDEDFVCQNASLLCPPGCRCYNGAKFPSVIVDCANLSLTRFPREISIPADGGELIVNLKYNNIQSFEVCSDPAYKWLRHVTRLNLKHNELTPKNPDHTSNFLSCINKTTHLYLANNNIEHLPMSIRLKSFTKLSLSGNKLVCDCTAYWLKDWLSANKKTIPRALTLNCYKKGRPIVQLEKADFICEDQPAYAAAGCMTGLVVTIVMLSATAYIYRFEIKILLFEKCNWHPFDRQEAEGDKNYDVYLMYCRDDEVWVHNTLLAGLEQLGYTTCVSRRDFAIGASSAAEMANAFSTTHRVVVVVSQSFIDSTNAMSDFYHAYEHDRSPTGRRFLILIKLREILNFRKHDIFKKYISTNYFVPIQAKRFWAQLRYWLPSLGRTVLPAGTDNIEIEGSPSGII